jgi:BirA family transcriptional regulator, biotin operon repressor / biotin---[acetyl-CoA-carboxylase] ligase
MLTQFFGHNRLSFETLPSTNTYALELLAGETPPEGTIVITGHQTRGRGQKGNVWTGEQDKNLTFSLILYPHFLQPRELFLISKMTALAVRATIAHFLPLQETLIKWPNDILLGRKKISGILIENQLEGSHVRTVVIGIGLNVGQVEFPAELSHKSVSLAMSMAAPPQVETVLQVLLRQLEDRYIALRSGYRDALHREYYEFLYAYGELVPIKTGEETLNMRVVGVDEYGRLAAEYEGSLRYFDIKEAGIQVQP